MNWTTRRASDYLVAVRYEESATGGDPTPQGLHHRYRWGIIYGADLPWSKMIIAYAQAKGSGGNSFILGAGGEPVRAASAALANKPRYSFSGWPVPQKSAVHHG
jgi:hypothetical protein